MNCWELISTVKRTQTDIEKIAICEFKSRKTCRKHEELRIRLQGKTRLETETDLDRDWALEKLCKVFGNGLH